MTTKANHFERYYDSHEVEGAELTQSVDHYLVIQYLIVVLQWIFKGKGIGVVSNVNFYQTDNPRETPISPDVAVVEGLPENRKSEDKSSYYVGETSPAPRVIIEIASKETWRQDLEDKPGRYHSMGINEYFVYDPNEPTVWTRQWRAHKRLIGWHRNAVSGEFELLQKDANGRLWSNELASWLVVESAGLRLYDANGQLRLTEAEALQYSLMAERLQKQKLAEKLKELGINPEELL